MATPRQLSTDITAGRYKPAYYFFGVEDYRIAEAEKFLAKRFLPDSQLGSNYRRLDGRKASSADVLAELASLSLLGDRRIVAVSDIQGYKPTEVDRILVALEPVDPGRLVIFSSPSVRMPKKTSSFFKKMMAAVEVVEFKRLTSRETTGLIASRFKKEGISIEPAAAELLAELVAGNLGGLESEISKLANYRSRGEAVTVADVGRVCSGYEVFTIFALADEIIAGRLKTALKMIGSLIAEGRSPAGITALLLQHFICVYLVKNGKKPLPGRDFPSLVNKFRAQSEKYDSDRLRRMIIEIAQADAEFRHSQVRPQTTLEVLTVRLSGERS